ncbi:hypothetical protein FACS1894130_06060 [Spirochaetia bacterium]|nr:hypothetical protein FACS1894130_06060 [Spirochaetia bacterium]
MNVLDTVCKDKYEEQNGYEQNATVVSDEFKGYNILDKKTKFIHLSVNHSLGQFSNGNGIHTNGIEGFMVFTTIFLSNICRNMWMSFVLGKITASIVLRLTQC